MRQSNYNIIPAQVAANVTSTALATVNTFYVSAQIIATGPIVGALKLQASNDNPSNPNQSPASNWSDIPSATVSVSAAGVFLIPKTDLCYRWIRAVYTHTSGTGTVTVNIEALAS